MRVAENRNPAPPSPGPAGEPPLPEPRAALPSAARDDPQELDPLSGGDPRPLPKRPAVAEQGGDHAALGVEQLIAMGRVADGDGLDQR
jgi:hypothetical protein